MTETVLRRRIVRALKTQWPLAWVWHPDSRFTSGIPDLLICVEGNFLAIEVKTPRGRIAPIQHATLMKIRRAGGRAWIIRSVEELDDVFHA